MFRFQDLTISMLLNFYILVTEDSSADAYSFKQEGLRVNQGDTEINCIICTEPLGALRCSASEVQMQYVSLPYFG